MKTFTPNTPFLTEKFNEFNAPYFDGKLPMVKFIYNNSTEKKTIMVLNLDIRHFRVCLSTQK